MNQQSNYESWRASYREIYMLDVLHQPFVPGLRDSFAQFAQKVLETQFLLVVEDSQFFPDLLGGVVKSPHAIQKVHRIGQVIALGSVGSVVGGPHFAPAGWQIGPRVAAQLHLHGFQHFYKLYRQCAQLVSKKAKMTIW